MPLIGAGGNKVVIANTSCNPVPVEVTNTITNPLEVKMSLDDMVSIRDGRVNGYSASQILAGADDVNTTERIISYGTLAAGIEPTFPADARILSIASTSANDTSAGTGARSILVIGLDTDYVRQTEVVILTGQTEVDTINLYLRVNVCRLVSSGSSNSNEGIIYISDSTDTFTLGVPQTRIYSTMPIGHSLTKNALFTIEAGKIAYPVINVINSDIGGSTRIMTIKFYRNIYPGNTFSISDLWYIDRSFSGDMRGIPEVSEKSDIMITGQMSSNTQAVDMKLQMIIKDI
jgi:hypothetical protein